MFMIKSGLKTIISEQLSLSEQLSVNPITHNLSLITYYKERLIIE
jgi:hypothetical protein